MASMLIPEQKRSSTQQAQSHFQTHSNQSTKGNAMTNSKIETFWATIAESPDLPKEIAKEIGSNIAMYHRGVKLWEAKRAALQTLTNDLRNAEQKAVINLLQELEAGTKNSIEKTSQNITELSDAVTDAQRQEQSTSAAMRRAEAQISSPASKHHLALIAWILNFV